MNADTDEVSGAGLSAEEIWALKRRGLSVYCPKCGKESGDDWTQCLGSCPMTMSPHYSLTQSYASQVDGRGGQVTLAAWEPKEPRGAGPRLRLAFALLAAYCRPAPRGWRLFPMVHPVRGFEVRATRMR